MADIITLNELNLKNPLKEIMKRIKQSQGHLEKIQENIAFCGEIYKKHNQSEYLEFTVQLFNTTLLIEQFLQDWIRFHD